jgi:hypothetical protein
MKDDRKSSCAVQIKASTPTVKAHYDRLVDMGLVNSVTPEIDSSRIDFHKRKQVLARKTLSKSLSKTSILA